jgi:hypothetical protein
MLVDIRRRPASQIRGSKRIWAATALVNSAGIGPLVYFASAADPPTGADLVNRRGSGEVRGEA